MKNNDVAELSKFTRKIGSTIYSVSVFGSQSSKETVEDKLLRLIKSEVGKSA
ncbi:MAG: transposon-encoded TnpW family protein [Defluviitaleaceae bacterium]|nr:transposon-encoded TnpW family protein [Defluviitaleaceae bacterium]